MRRRMARSEPLHTRASIALRQCGHSPDQIARTLKIPRSVVSNWCDGWSTPRGDRQIELAHKYKIDRAWWREPVEAGLLAGLAQSEEPPPCKQGDAGSTPATGSDLSAPVTGVVAMHETQILLKQARMFREKVETDPLLSLSEKARVLASAGQTIFRLQKHTGEALEISEAKIMKTPAWARVKAVLLAALRPWPDALRAVGKALGELDR